MSQFEMDALMADQKMAAEASGIPLCLSMELGASGHPLRVLFQQSDHRQRLSSRLQALANAERLRVACFDQACNRSLVRFLRWRRKAGYKFSGIDFEPVGDFDDGLETQAALAAFHLAELRPMDTAAGCCGLLTKFKR